MATYCNTADILTTAMTKFSDDSDDLRVLALGWLNEIVRDVLNQPRTWWFLKTGTSLSVTANAITLPSGMGEVINIEGTDFFLTPSDQLTDEEVYSMNDDDDTTPPVGYTQTATTITFYPAATGTVTLRYEADLTADYTDAATATIFPIAFKPLLVAGVRMQYYDYDKDGRYQSESALYNYHMKHVKVWDNDLKPNERKNPHGYTRVS